MCIYMCVYWCKHTNKNWRTHTYRHTHTHTHGFIYLFIYFPIFISNSGPWATKSYLSSSSIILRKLPTIAEITRKITRSFGTFPYMFLPDIKRCKHTPRLSLKPSADEPIIIPVCIPILNLVGVHWKLEKGVLHAHKITRWKTNATSRNKNSNSVFLYSVFYSHVYVGR